VKRSPLVLAATVAGTAGVLTFHPHVPTRASASAAATATPSATATATVTKPSAGVSGTETGNAIDTQYGAAQVKVTVKNGKITAVQALQLQGNDPKSYQISTSAEPVLRQQVLTAQTAAVDAVSGATFTSASYEQSLQSALDKLGYKAPDGSRATLQIPADGGHGR
jgi:uncharacterized protein with FMN-binding domain